MIHYKEHGSGLVRPYSIMPLISDNILTRESHCLVFHFIMFFCLLATSSCGFCFSRREQLEKAQTADRVS